MDISLTQPIFLFFFLSPNFPPCFPPFVFTILPLLSLHLPHGYLVGSVVYNRIINDNKDGKNIMLKRDIHLAKSEKKTCGLLEMLKTFRVCRG